MPRRQGPAVLSKPESDHRFRDLKAAGCHPKRVTLPDGDQVVVRDKACKCPQCTPPVGEASPRARRSSPATAVLPARAARERGTSGRDPYPEVRRRMKAQGAIVRPEDAAYILMPIQEAEVQEVAVVLSLNVHSVGVGVHEIARGGIEHVDMVIPLGVRSVAMDGSLWAVLAHNHPSGAADPSRADVQLWHAARRQFGCAGMTLCDHLVLGSGEFYSCMWGSRWRLPRGGR